MIEKLAIAAGAVAGLRLAGWCASMPGVEAAIAGACVAVGLLCATALAGLMLPEESINPDAPRTVCETVLLGLLLTFSSFCLCSALHVIGRVVL